MAYVRRTWQERVGTLLNRFIKSSETPTSVVLVNDPDTITQAGTPFTAAAMNNIEDGIVEALAKVPTGVNNNILLSDGAGKAKDSGKAIGNASGNVPLSNGTKCVNLYSAKSAEAYNLLPTQFLGTAGTAIDAIPLIVNQGNGEYVVNYGKGFPLGANDPNVYECTASGCIGGVYAKINARLRGTKTEYVGVYNNGVWSGWTQLTDASGNAMNANSLGGVAAAFYTGFIGNGTTLQDGSMANDTSITVNAGCSGHITIRAYNSTENTIQFFIGGREVAGAFTLSLEATYPIKAGQTFKAYLGRFSSATFFIKAALS